MTNEKTFIIMDTQEESNHWSENLQGIKDYIISFWNENDTDNEVFETEEEYNEFIKKVAETTELSDLDNYLQGFGYTVFESEADMMEWIEA